MPVFRDLQLLPPTASSFAHQLDALVIVLTVCSGIIVLLVLSMCVYFGLRYRRRFEDEIPVLTPAPKWLEVSIVFVFTGVFMVFFAWGAVLFVDSRRPPAQAIEVDVLGKQWMWKLQHPGGQREINELHVPVNRAVKLNMISQDVIHSFSVPAFRIKQDVLPGRYTSQWFIATRPGEYHLFCQEYCGTEHSMMRGRVIVMEEKDYQAWLIGAPADAPPAIAGAQIYRALGCQQCHGQSAPTLAGLYGRKVLLDDRSEVLADDQYLRDSILNPAQQIVAGYGPIMPAYRGQVSEEQLSRLIAYIKSLSNPASQPAGRTP